MTNKEFCGVLQQFVSSKRPEYLSRGKASSLATMTEEAKATAEDLRRQAVALIAAVASSPGPNAWAVLSKATPFDGYKASVARGETIKVESGLVDYLINEAQGQQISIRLHEHLEHYEPVFLAGGDIHRAIYDDARKDYERLWGVNAVNFPSLESWCAQRGWDVPEPVNG